MTMPDDGGVRVVIGVYCATVRVFGGDTGGAECRPLGTRQANESDWTERAKAMVVEPQTWALASFCTAQVPGVDP